MAAIALHQQAKLSFWDAMVVHAAAESGCDVLWSEDLKDRQVLRGVQIRNPLPDDTIAYTYDLLGRVQARAINGVPLTYTYDALGRVTEEVNALGTFT